MPKEEDPTRPTSSLARPRRCLVSLSAVCETLLECCFNTRVKSTRYEACKCLHGLLLQSQQHKTSKSKGKSGGLLDYSWAHAQLILSVGRLLSKGAGRLRNNAMPRRGVRKKNVKQALAMLNSLSSENCDAVTEKDLIERINAIYEATRKISM